MLRRTAQLSVGLLLILCPVLLSAQAQFYVFCAAQAPPAAAGQPATVYYSGIMQSTAASLQNIRTGFTQFLMQRFAYKGAAGCAPENSMANAQTAMNNQMTAFRNAKRNIVQTGWSGGGLLGSGGNPLGNILGGGQPQTTPTPAQPAAPVPAATTTAAPAKPAGGTTAAGGNQGGGNQAGGNQNSAAGIFGQIFGSNTGGGTGGAKPTQGQATTGGKTTGGGTEAPGAGGNQSPFSQVSGAMQNIFGNKGGSNNPGRGGQPQPGQPGQPQPGGNTVVPGREQPGQPGGPGAKPGQPGQADGVLGSAQFGTTKLDIYGCGRQDMQVACVAQLTNLNPKDTLVKGTDVWKDAFLVDDRGDRHARTNAFFLNIDGEQRPQLDISNGKTAKFVLMFDNVPTKVQSVHLRSQNGNMDVESIGLVAADGSASGAASASEPQR